ncbi:MAG TPA: DUF5666 domain-containing protein [Vicinamibacteria bacterium]|nr:DUF5666 domain-containing protein [Vicinamibacteria bacterium]
MRRRRGILCLAVVVAGVAALVTGCGGSGATTGPDQPKTAAAGNAVLQGSVHGSSEGLRVSVAGTSLAATVDDDGQFVMSSLPSGSITLRFDGAGSSASLKVDGLRDGQVTTITVTLSGNTAQLNGAPGCAPDTVTHFSGNVEQIEGGRMTVSGRVVDTSQLKKVWRAGSRVELSDIQAGEKVRVWGTLRGDGVMVADEIECLTMGPGSGSDTWVSFSGQVESVSVSASALASHDLHANPNKSLTIVVADRTVHTDSGTKFVWSDHSSLSPNDIKPGQSAFVEGWKNAEGNIRATTFQVEGSGKGTLVSFKGKVESVTAYSRDGRVIALGDGRLTASCNLELVIAGHTVRTDGSTDFKWSDGTDLDYTVIVVGDTAYVEGWNQPGYVQASKLVVNTR